jgi:hypothetical protein
VPRSAIDDGAVVDVGDGPCDEYLLGRQCAMGFFRNAKRERGLSLAVGLDDTLTLFSAVDPRRLLWLGS